jgi:hypothetical protein
MILVFLGNEAPEATVYAHLSGSTIQQWVDKETCINIQFVYLGQKGQN